MPSELEVQDIASNSRRIPPYLDLDLVVTIIGTSAFSESELGAPAGLSPDDKSTSLLSIRTLLD